MRAVREVKRFFEVNMYYIGIVVQVSGGYVALFLLTGFPNMSTAFYCVPIISYIIGAAIKGVADRNGKGNVPPVPEKRYTHTGEYGEVSIEQEDLPDAILFLNDLEEYYTRKGELYDVEQDGVGAGAVYTNDE